MLSIAAMMIFPLGMAAGQVLYKLASKSIVRSRGGGALFESILINPFLWLAAALYVSLSIYWVWLLSFTPMSRAYPFQALAFVLIPIAGVVFFQEPFTQRLAIGIPIIVAGILIISG